MWERGAPVPYSMYVTVDHHRRRYDLSALAAARGAPGAPGTGPVAAPRPPDGGAAPPPSRPAADETAERSGPAFPCTPSLAVPLPSPEVVVSTRANIIQWIPRDARPAWDRLLTRVLERLAHTRDDARFVRYLMLARVVLAKPAARSGGLAHVIAARCRRAMANDFAALGEMWYELYPSDATQLPSDPADRDDDDAAVAPPAPPAPEPADGAGGDAAAVAPPAPPPPAGAMEAPPPLAQPGLVHHAEPPSHARTDIELAFGPVVDVDSLTSKQLKQMAHHGHAGEYSKAAAACGAAEAAAKTRENADLLRPLHPHEDPPPPRAPPACSAPPPVSKRKVRGCLRSFKLASSGGQSLLTPQHLKDACSAPGSTVYEALTSAMVVMMSGLVPVSARPYMCGARLVGLVKKDRTLRPVAAGDVLRRMAGRLLSRAVAGDARKYFLERKQVGVAVEGGADAAIAACRDTARTLPDGHVIVKLDQKNAFNSVSRKHMLEIVAKEFPTLYPYAQMAYGNHSWLYFGSHRIDSCTGVQQGCPLGPLFFSLVMASARRKALAQLDDATRAALTFEAWFLDDGTVAGPQAAVAAYVEKLETECAACGPSTTAASASSSPPAPSSPSRSSRSTSGSRRATSSSSASRAARTPRLWSSVTSSPRTSRGACGRSAVCRTRSSSTRFCATAAASR